MANHFYLTTTLPYVNAEPHIGFALEITEADVIARYQRLLGNNVIFNTGTDEHGQKIYEKAVDTGEEPQAYVDRFAAKFADLKAMLNLSYTHFIRTTDAHHITAAQEFWRRCDANGDIYKKLYQTKYCVGCELEKTDSELVDGRCPLHPKLEIQLIEEENYFFKFSRFQEPLLQYYQDNPEFVKPAGKMSEITSFVKQGLQDFSISRLKSKMPWGIPVPGDEEHVMYVWFDALVNYISTLGWPDGNEFTSFWPGIQLAGKDNLRQQSAMWQAMLASAGVPFSQKILINGFIGVNGQKMSKSLGNVIAPQELVSRFGIDGTRYLLINLGTFGEDMDVTHERLDTTYTAELSNGLGNLCSRVAKLCEKDQLSRANKTAITLDPAFTQCMDNYDLSLALGWTRDQVAQLDKFLSDTTPWKLEADARKDILLTAVEKIVMIATHVQPFMPETAAKILQHFDHSPISALEPLFPRLPKPL